MRINGLIVLGLTAALAVFLLAPAAFGDDDDDHRGAARSTSTLLASPEYKVYAEECGSCHLAFPPGLLPRRSWARLMTGLDDHFGDTASLDAEKTRLLADWLAANAAEARTHQKSAKILRSTRGATPLRITEVPYIVRKHDEIAPKVFARPSVTSRANCAACHQGAERWLFDDDNVRIPVR